MGIIGHCVTHHWIIGQPGIAVVRIGSDNRTVLLPLRALINKEARFVGHWIDPFTRNHIRVLE